jgi:hypothetical protein
MTLYEIDKSIEQLVNAVDPETGELLVDNDALDALMMERDGKIENIACFIKNLTADAKALKDEEAALAERRKAAEKKAERLKDYLTYVLGGEKFQTVKCAVSFRKSQTVEIDEGFPEWAEKTGNDNLLRYKAPEANKVAIKALLAQGADIPCARLTQNTSITIK